MGGARLTSGKHGQWCLQALQAPLPGKPQQPMPNSEFRNDNIHNIPQQRFQINFLQRYWIISASQCVEPQNDSPHLQRWEPPPASPRRIKSCNGTVRRGKCPSSPRRALAHRGTTRTRLDDHKSHPHLWLRL